MNFNFVSDNLDRRGYISKETILTYVTQEEIFELVLGYRPQEFQYITSPLRNDRTPRCYFEYHNNGVLYFIDFAGKRKHSDCFNIVQDFYGIPNFYLTLEFIFDKLIKGRNINIEAPIYTPSSNKEIKLPVRILVESREWEIKDERFWYPYDISQQQLIEDKVFPVQKFHLLNTKKGSFSKSAYDAAYAFTDFKEGRKKLYFPYREGANRFISTCTRNDIGGMSYLPALGRQLIISKSYKDSRVLRNQGKYAVWLQNEGMRPDPSLIISLCRNFREVIVFFDNDYAGVNAAIEISNLINTHLPGKARPLWLPETLLSSKIKDPSDLLHRRGKQSLLDFLNQRT